MKRLEPDAGKLARPVLRGALRSNAGRLPDSYRRWTGRGHLTDTYRYCNDLPLRNGADALRVNWCELTTTNDQGTVIYRNSFVTDWPLTEANVSAMVQAGRTRWKVENKSNYSAVN